MSPARSGKLMSNPRLRALMVAWMSFQSANFAHGVLVVVFAFAAGGVGAAGAVTALRLLPGGLVAPLTTSLASSSRPQLHLGIGIGARCLASAATLVAVLGGAPVGVVLALTALDSLMAAAVRPLHGALVVRLADTTAEAASANRATASLISGGTCLGPAAAGVALAIVGVGWAFVVPTVVFAVGSIAALSIKMPAAEEAPKAAAAPSGGVLRARLSAIGAGYRAIGQRSPAVAATFLYVLNTALVGFFLVASAPAARDHMRLGRDGITEILTIFGAGGLFGGLVIMSIAGGGRLARLLSVAMVAWALTLAGLGESVVAAVGLAMAVGCGASSAVGFAVAPQLVQRSVAREAMVAASTVLQSLFQVAQAAGALLAPVLIRHFGLPYAMAAAGVAAVAITALAWPQSRKSDALSDDDAAKLAVVRATPTLNALPVLALEQLARAATRLAVPAGAEVIQQGDPGDRFYMIAAGLADVAVDGRRVGTLGPGGSFGEIALLRDVPRSATVTAREDLDLVVVDRGDFLGAMSGGPETGGRVSRAALERLETPPVEDYLVELDRDSELAGRSVTELLATQPPLASIGSEALGELASTARVLAVPDGAPITREGDYGCTYYVILDGGAQVFEDGALVNNLASGDGFGEHAILRDIPRTATVRAVGDVKLLAVSRESFQHALLGA